MERVYTGRNGERSSGELHCLLRDQFDYAEGRLNRKSRPGYKWAHQKDRRASIRIDGVRLTLGVAVYLYHNGSLFQDEWVDHKDRDPTNNRIENLRIATSSENAANRSMKSRTKARYKGVSLTKQGTWRARLVKNGVEIWGGAYSSEEEAAEAYNKLAAAHFGEFAALNQIKRDL